MCNSLIRIILQSQLRYQVDVAYQLEKYKSRGYFFQMKFGFKSQVSPAMCNVMEWKLDFGITHLVIRKFSEKRTFLIPWYTHVHVRISR